MATSSYASLLERNPLVDFTLTAAAGGTTTGATNYYYFVYGLARGGINLGRNMGQVAVSAGQKLQFQINASARTAGLDPFAFVIGAATTNDETLSKILAVAFIKDPDQVTDRSLPLTIELTTDEDFILGGSVATFASLPTTPVAGAVRFVTDESTYYQYDDEGWYANDATPTWKVVYGDDLYLADTTTLRSGTNWRGGADVPINSFVITTSQTADFYGVITPSWSGSGAASTPIRVWLLNGLLEAGGEIVTQNSQLSVIGKVNDSTELGAGLLSDNLTLDALRTIRRLDGSENSSLSGTFTFVSGTPFYTMEADLNPGYAIEFSYTTTAVVGDGDRVTIYLRDDGEFGVFQAGTTAGEAIYAPLNRARIVPNTNGIKRLSGTGFIETDGQPNGYLFNTQNELGVTLGIVADTSLQQVAISGLQNGGITIYQNGTPLPSTQALRALLSTEIGTATASSYSAGVVVGASGRIEFTVNLPTAIRSDYPDTRIASNSDAVRNIPQFRTFVLFSGTIYELAAQVVSAGASQLFVLDDLSSGVVVGSLPSNGDTEFNLWGYEAITGVSSGSGSLAAGTYQLAIAWDYPTPNLSPTKINHDPVNGCIVELNLSFADAIALAEAYSEIYLEAVLQAVRKGLNFNSRLVTITDNPGLNRLDWDIPDVPRVNVIAAAPTVNDDSTQDYEAGDFWVDITGSPADVYVCEDNTATAAVWNTFGGGAGADEQVKITGSDTTTGYLNAKITVSDGMAKTITSPGGNEALDLKYDFNTLTEEASPASGDFLPIYDVSGTAYKKVDYDNISGGGGLTYSYQTTNFAATEGNQYGVNTSSAVVTATLPASPTGSNAIGFHDANNNFGTNQLTIDPNGNSISGIGVATLTLTNNKEGVILQWNSTLSHWEIVQATYSSI